ncbi:MAG: LarC family nickel insertion protein [Actinomycetota bacterium]
MRIAYLDCSSGISGTMALAALLDAGADLDVVRTGLSSLPVGPFSLEVVEERAGDLRALRVVAEAKGPEPRRTLGDLEAMLRAAALPHRARALAERVYRRLAGAEARVHGTAPDRVTFHEVGSVRSIAGVVGTAVALDELGVAQVWSSPVATGWGAARTEHGLLPVPAPATAELLRGIPAQPGSMDGELATPTGAALVAELAEAFVSSPPAMDVEAVGLGAGPLGGTFANVLRVLIGNEARSATA